jgi:GTP-binding protein
VRRVSAATTEGVRDLAFTLAAVVEAARRAAPPPEPTRLVLRPQPAAGPDFELVPLGDNSFRVVGEKPRRWILQTDFSNDEAVGYLADRLARLGIENALAEAGAAAGAEVLIGEEDNSVVFDWDPSLPAEQTALGRRGTDPRLG